MALSLLKSNKLSIEGKKYKQVVILKLIHPDFGNEGFGSMELAALTF
jgi:hypothetical protein